MGVIILMSWAYDQLQTLFLDASGLVVISLLRRRCRRAGSGGTVPADIAKRGHNLFQLYLVHLNMKAPMRDIIS